MDAMKVLGNGVSADRAAVNHAAANGTATEEVTANGPVSQSEVSQEPKMGTTVTDNTGPVNVTTTQTSPSLKEHNGERETERSADMTASIALERKAKGFIEKMEGMERLDSFSILETSTQKPTASAEISAADLKATEPLQSEENQKGDRNEDHQENEEQRKGRHHENNEHQQNGLTEVVESSQQKEGVAQGGQPELDSGGGNQDDDDDFWFETSQLLGKKVHVYWHTC